MSERAVIKDRLRKKEQEIQSLEEKLRSAKVYVQALQDILKVLDRAGDESSIETVLKPGSTVSQARDVILTARRPVHVDEILEAMGKIVTPAARASLTGSLAAYVRRGEIFTRTTPNTYGLSELGHSELALDERAPPSGFGISDDEEIEF